MVARLVEFSSARLASFVPRLLRLEAQGPPSEY